MPAPDPLVARSYVAALTDERLMQDLQQVANKTTYHNPTYRKALIEEMNKRYAALLARLKELTAAG